MSDTHELLAAAFSAMLGVEVSPPIKGASESSGTELVPRSKGASLGMEVVPQAHLKGAPSIPKLSVHQLFRATYIMRPPASIEPAERFDVVVRTLTGMEIVVPVSRDHTIAELKAAISEQEDIHPHEQCLVFDRKSLDDDQTLGDIGFSAPRSAKAGEGKLVPFQSSSKGAQPGMVSSLGALSLAERPAPGQQDLMFNGQKLGDQQKLRDIGVPPNGVIFLVIKTRGGGAAYQLDPNDLAPGFDYDYTNKKDDGKKHMRGAFEYKRPFGWKRYALKVLDRPEYGDSKWLGPGGMRQETDGVEWPVSYHGTDMESTKKIVKEGLKAGDRRKFGRGVYTSPSVTVAEGYSKIFRHRGDRYHVILQNRVNPAAGHLERIDASRTRDRDEYWVSPLNDHDNGVYDVRPYNVLMKKL